MASKIKIARGNITAFKNALKQGELFFQIRNLTDDYSRSPHDEGVLYIGDPKADFNSDPIPLAAARSVKANVFRGDLGATTSAQDFNINQPKFKYVRPGDFYYWTLRATDMQKIPGEEIDYAFMRDDFREGDMLLITDCDVDPKTGIAYNIEYRRVMTGSCDARNVYYYIYDEFGDIDTDIDIDNVNDVLKFLERHKLQYRGVIDDDFQLKNLRTDATDPEYKVTRGSIWLVLKDDLDWPNLDAMLAQKRGRKPKRGDFVYYENEKCTFNGLDTYPAWKVIPCADSDAEDIDYLQYNAQIADLRTAMENMGKSADGDKGTFHIEHIEQALLSTDVRKALDFLMVNKAQLDEMGKVPLSQLHATVLGALQYKGVWSPINDARGVTDPAYQNKTPSFPTGHDEYGNPTTHPENGDYYQVKIDVQDGDNKIINIQFQDPYNPTRILELNNGDFIVWQASDDQDNDIGQGRWEVIDNSDRIISLDFTINGKLVSNDALYNLPARDISLVQSPHINADKKLCLVQDGQTVTICGVRLVDQEVTPDGELVDGKVNYLPKYSPYGRNTLTNTDIRNYLRERTMQYVFSSPTVKEFDTQSFNPVNNTTSNNSGLSFKVSPEVQNPKLHQDIFGVTGTGTFYVPVSVGSEVTIILKDPAEGITPVISAMTDTLTKVDEHTYKFTSSVDGYEQITFKDATIGEVDVADYQEKITEFMSNVQIGDFQNSHAQITYGDISLSSYMSTHGAGTRNPRFNFYIKSEADDRAVDFTKVSLFANDKLTEEDIELILPEKSSTIIAKLPGVVFAKNHILKSTVDGYAESAATLEELTDSEGNTYISNSTYIQSPDVHTHNVTLGFYDESTHQFVKTINVKGPSQPTSPMATFYITRGGHAFTLEQYMQFIGNGTDGTVPVFKKHVDEVTGEETIGLSDSKIKQIQHSIFETLKNSARARVWGNRYDENGQVVQFDYSEEFLKNRYGDRKDASTFANDVIIGEVEEAGDGTYRIKEGGERGLHVSNGVAIGNSKTSVMHLLAGRSADNKRDIPELMDGEPWEDEDIEVEAPLRSGMMLTHNSPISGGLWI